MRYCSPAKLTRLCVPADLPSAADQAKLMTLALQQAEQCIPTSTAFCVGAVISSPETSDVLSTGYSRELEGNTHAEANAIDKLLNQQNEQDKLPGCDIYTTMEPCSVRLSGNVDCTKRILQAGIKRVFLGTVEPDDFVKCEGVQLLKDAGVEVYSVPGFAERCLEVARRGH
jgi:pyrimidine deaminase RibD-like protein